MVPIIPGLPVRHGKVRDVYDRGDGNLILVASDRISAFDWILPTKIPDKGRALTLLSEFWFRHLSPFGLNDHLLTTDVHEMSLPAGADLEALAGRTMLVVKTQVVPIECVVRGYLAGSGWKEYRQTGMACGLPLPAGLRESDRLAEPIFTPATKEASGHDVNISFEEMVKLVGEPLAVDLRQRSLALYARGAERARRRNIIIADTKFEWGQIGDNVFLIDEIFTPDSSRFWPTDQYQPGTSPPSFDKQYVRDWLEASGWDKNSQPPVLPSDVVTGTRSRYIQAFEQITEEPFPWK